MRINGKKVIALAITIVMLCLQPAQSLSGTHVEAESRQQYVARLKQFDSVKALEKAGYEPGKDFMIAMDAASSEWKTGEKGKYKLPKAGTVYTSEKLIEHWKKNSRLYLSKMR